MTRVRQTVDGEEYPYRALKMAGNTQAEDLLGYKLCLFNNVPGEVDDPHYRNPRQTGNVRYEIDFRPAVDHNITVVIWSEYENLYEIDQFGGILYSLNR